ncbi:MAG: sulfite exporter TauE/SafE family protein [Roseiarcus sp.]
MAPVSLTFAGGLLMGLASSLHCAGMCGAIASSLLMAFNPSGVVARARVHFSAQAGRVLVYVASGALLGGAGSMLYGQFDHASAYLALRWAAAVALGWIGLSVTGFAPSLAILDRATAPITARLDRVKAAAGASEGGAFVSGLIWGFLPCGMVYGALFYAMLSGSALGGAEVMAGFGLGTLPSVTSVALGLATFRRLGDIPRARIVVGVTIMALAAASVAVPAASLAAMCGLKM